MNLILKDLNDVDDFQVVDLNDFNANVTSSVVPIEWGHELVHSVIGTHSLFFSDGKVNYRRVISVCSKYGIPGRLVINYLKNNEVKEFFSPARYLTSSNIQICFVSKDDILGSKCCPFCSSKLGGSMTKHVSDDNSWKYNSKGQPYVGYRRTVPGRMVAWAYEHSTLGNMASGYFTIANGQSYYVGRHSRYQYGHEHVHYIPMIDVYVEEEYSMFGLCGPMNSLLYLQLRCLSRFLIKMNDPVRVKGREHSPLLSEVVAIMKFVRGLPGGIIAQIALGISLVIMYSKTDTCPSDCIMDEDNEIISSMAISYLASTAMGNKLLDFCDGEIDNLGRLCCTLDMMSDEFLKTYAVEFDALDLDCEVLAKNVVFVVVTKENYEGSREYYLGDDSMVMVRKVTNDDDVSYFIESHSEKMHAEWMESTENARLIKAMDYELSSRTVVTQNSSVVYRESVLWFTTTKAFSLDETAYYWLKFDEALDIVQKKSRTVLVDLRNKYIKKYRTKHPELDVDPSVIL